MPGPADSKDVKGDSSQTSVNRSSSPPAASTVAKPHEKEPVKAASEKTSKAPPAMSTNETGIRVINRSGGQIRVIAEEKDSTSGEWGRASIVPVDDGDMTILEVTEDRRIVIDQV